MSFIKDLLKWGVVRGSRDPVTGGIKNLTASGVTLGLQSALKQVATRCYIPEHRNTTIHQLMARERHTARDVITGLQLVYPSWAVLSGTTETAQGAASSITASIEYPAGTYTQVTFSGSATGTMPDDSNFVSDSVSVYIPNGAQFWVRTWVSNATALVYNGKYKAVTGDGIVSSATTTPDLTMGGAVTQATVNMYGPCAIIAQTMRRSVCIIGDSIGYGTGDTASTGDIGNIGRSLGGVIPYICAAIPSDSANAFKSSHTHRVALSAYCTDVVIQYGTNDIPGTAGATVLADFAIVAGYFSAATSLYFCTIPPRTTSTDSWVTTANQTVTVNEAARLVVNTGVRAGIAGAAGCFDVAAALESSWNSGFWTIDTGAASPAMTADGVHPSINGYTKVKSLAIVNPALFAY